MIPRKGLKVGDRGTLEEFKETFTLEHLGKNGFYYINRDSSKLVTKDGMTAVSSNDMVTYLGHKLWHIDKGN